MIYLFVISNKHYKLMFCAVVSSMHNIMSLTLAAFYNPSKSVLLVVTHNVPPSIAIHSFCIIILGSVLC